MIDVRRISPAADRNKQAILDVLIESMPDSGHAIVIADGTGQHTSHFATHFTNWTWQPTDYDKDNLESINAWSGHLKNVLPAIQLDVETNWPKQAISAVFNANMIHISPWSTCIGLMKNAGQRLSSGQPLFLYGPFKEGGQHTSESNAAFDVSLQQRDRSWGVRDIEAVIECALENGLEIVQKHKMPANNLTLLFRKM